MEVPINRASSALLLAGVTLIAAAASYCFFEYRDTRAKSTAPVRTVAPIERLPSNPEPVISVTTQPEPTPFSRQAAVERTDQLTASDIARPEADIARRQGSIMNPLSDGRFELEPVDPDWAPQMAATFTEVVATLEMPLQQVRPPECRTTVCRMTVTHDGNFTAMDDEARAEILRPEGRKFRDAMASLIASSNGRLTQSGVMTKAPRLPGEPWETTFFVLGPPLEER